MLRRVWEKYGMAALEVLGAVAVIVYILFFPGVLIVPVVHYFGWDTPKREDPVSPACKQEYARLCPKGGFGDCMDNMTLRCANEVLDSINEPQRDSPY
jgi:hypothetical protein